MPLSVSKFETAPRKKSKILLRWSRHFRDYDERMLTVFPVPTFICLGFDTFQSFLAQPTDMAPKSICRRRRFEAAITIGCKSCFERSNLSNRLEVVRTKTEVLSRNFHWNVSLSNEENAWMSFTTWRTYYIGQIFFLFESSWDYER